MALFQVSRTFDDPGTSQSGFPAPGTGAQTTGDPSYASMGGDPVLREPLRPTKGIRSWLYSFIKPDMTQSGMPEPGDPGQLRPAGSRPNVPDYSGMPDYVYTPYYSRGTAAEVPNFGKTLTNPIGAGVVALYRPQASYGGAAQYENGALWWTNQVIPTSVNLQGLTDPEELASIFDGLQVQAVMRTTG